MSDHKPPSLNWVEDHYKLIQELYQTELSTNAPTATINNPAWFKHTQGALIVTESRKDLHFCIYETLLAGYQPAQQTPTAILLAGPPGSGKSTSLNTIFASQDNQITNGLDRSDFVVIDADEIKSLLIDQARKDGTLESFIKSQAIHQREAGGEIFSDLDFSSLVHAESSLIADNLTKRAIQNNYNVIIDQVGAKEVSVRDSVNLLKDNGFSISVVKISASREFSLASTYSRYARSWLEGKTARRVPTEVVEGIYTADGTPKPDLVYQSLLSDKPCPIGVYRGFEAKILGEPPTLVEKGQRSPDGIMHVTKVTQPTRAKIGRQDIIDSLQKIQKPTRPKPARQTRPPKKLSR